MHFPKIVKNLFTTNEVATISKPAVAQYESLRLNFETNIVRNEEMEGRPYTVVPMVMMVEGVHAGSSGPLLYTANELGKTPEVWNHKPVVVYHPKVNGQGVSACDPVIINQYKIGLIMNTKYEDGKLKAEAWIENHRADEVDDRIMPAILNQQIMELSTGVFVDTEHSEGVWNDGESYDAITTNYRPDHLAILPDQIGACSVAKGAGFIRNQKDLNVNVTINDGIIAKAREKVFSLIKPYIQINEISHGDVRSQLYGLTQELLKTPNMKWVDAWIEDVFDSYFVYEFEGKLFKIGYNTVQESVTLVGDSVEVIRKTSYLTTDGNPVGNQSETKTNNIPNTMDKDEIASGLISNHGWVEADRELLINMSEAQLQRIVDNTKQPETKTETKEPATATPEKVIVNEEVETVEAYIAKAPEAIQQVMNSALANAAGAKTAHIKTITENVNNSFTEEALANKSVEELASIVSLIGNKVEATVPLNSYNYGGRTPVPVPVSNDNKDEEPMELPTMNFESAGS